MEQTALRPTAMPGRDAGGTAPLDGGDPAGPRHPHPARRRGRLVNPLLALFAGLTLVLAGFGLGAVAATATGISRLAEDRQRPARQAYGPFPGERAVARPGTGRAPGSSAPPPPLASAGATLGLEAVDDDGPGARVVGVHAPGPGHSAGLVRGDVLLAFGTARVDTAADLARAVSRADPGERVSVVVRHESGGFRRLTVVPGVVT